MGFIAPPFPPVPCLGEPSSLFAILALLTLTGLFFAALLVAAWLLPVLLVFLPTVLARLALARLVLSLLTTLLALATLLALTLAALLLLAALLFLIAFVRHNVLRLFVVVTTLQRCATCVPPAPIRSQHSPPEGVPTRMRETRGNGGALTIYS